MRRTATVFLVLVALACATKPSPLPPGVTAPVILHKVDPELPPAYQIVGKKVVTISALITKNGGISDPFVLRSSDSRLNAFALEAVRQWKFKPGTVGGEPVDVHFVVEVRFFVP